MRLTIAASAAGLVAATLVPGAVPGLGFAMAAVTVAAATLVAVGRPPSVPEAAAGVALIGVAPAFSDAAWLLVPALAVAVTAASLSLAGATTWSAALGGTVAWLRRLLPGARAVVAPVADRLDRSAATSAVVAVARAGGLAIVLLVVFGALFASADRAFAHLASRYLVPDIEVGLLPARAVILVGAGLLTSSLVGVAHAGHRSDGFRVLPERLLRPVDWSIAVGALDLLFLAFVLLQVTVLFGGHDHVLETAGLTYAEYAREGFFQLIVVGALTLAVVAAASRFTTVDRILRGLLGGLAGLSLLVLWSALRRLTLYEQAFGFTRTRIAAHVVLLLVAAVLVALLVTGATRRLRWMPRLTVGLVVAATVASLAIRPDALVAERNIERWQATGRIDLAYLDRLSADAVPALVELPDGLRGCLLADDRERLAVADGWRSWNLSRSRARAAMEGLVVTRCHGRPFGR